MINPLLGSIAFGLVKGLLTERAPAGTFGDYVVSPLGEEAMFRAVPLSAGRLPFGSTAVPFALAHMGAPGAGFGRFVDVALGGLLYEMAYRRWGFFGAVASHCAHNLACGLGGVLKPGRRVRR